MKFFTQRETHSQVVAFLDEWLPDPDKYERIYVLWDMWECEPLHLDVDKERLDVIFKRLKEKGFAYTIKAIFQGDHFYRDDTGKCPRCYRHRPEVAYDIKRGLKDVVCIRCRERVI